MSDSKRNISKMWSVACAAVLILSVLLVCGCTTTSSSSSNQSVTSATTHQATSVVTTTVAAANNTSVAAANTTAKAGTHDLTVYAAASLTDASKTLGSTFEQSHPDVSVKFNLAGTQVLRSQVENGASADVFLSAGTAHMTALKGEGYINNTSVNNFTVNYLTVALPSNNPGNISTLQDLAIPGKKIVMGTADVPVGTATRTLISKLTNDTAYGQDYQTKVMSNVISYETEVTGIVSKVMLGEADAGFVYTSSLTGDQASQMKFVKIPDKYNDKTVYQSGVLKNSTQASDAGDFVTFLSSADGQAILKQYGFVQG
ncbi:molybdenum ABC transporter, periplasmic molybdate-binding protein [Methanosphaerula palustris E1-9c]|uniref:Molybdenum ABC transporter, periplasmic molybdate-binding protein n=2 Tax=Methanosphaerula palustris TaxID=475088 RepID=B8GJ23_METPE|nr:molybdenum ABC transporter, periplasmic molybdate-binding protein [Methanosphaerula palustris E1-9c]